jgi:hypothetical protein
MPWLWSSLRALPVQQSSCDSPCRASTDATWVQADVEQLRPPRRKLRHQNVKSRVGLAASGGVAPPPTIKHPQAPDGHASDLPARSRAAFAAETPLGARRPLLS